MPYDIKKVEGGYKVKHGSKSFSKKAKSKKAAREQQQAIYANTRKDRY